MYLPGYIYCSASWSLFAHQDIFVSLSNANMAAKHANRWGLGSNAMASYASNGQGVNFNLFNLHDELLLLIVARRCTLEARTSSHRSSWTSPAQ